MKNNNIKNAFAEGQKRFLLDSLKKYYFCNLNERIRDARTNTHDRNTLQYST